MSQKGEETAEAAEGTLQQDLTMKFKGRILKLDICL